MHFSQPYNKCMDLKILFMIGPMHEISLTRNKTRKCFFCVYTHLLLLYKYQDQIVDPSCTLCEC